MNEQYISERLNPQISYYDTKSITAKGKYYALSVGNIALTASIPFITMFSDDFPDVKYLIAAVGAVASVLSSVLLLKKHKEIWLEYRATCEVLRSELELYRHSAGVYKTLPVAERDSHFVDRCEEIMCSEHTSWASRMKKEESQK